ncbi:MAG TPA: zinc ribbon domain-containing protein [Phycisphaerales bacterium]|nr:zinc ribbon domain-containing protein [Phycisphaerales bacterium]
MPTYEYKCTGCSHAFERFQSMKDGPLRKCPKCGRLRLERLIGTGAAVIFKGSGFYQTDYRSEAYKKSAETDTKAAEPKTETKTETKADAKGGETKAEAKPATPKVEAKPAPEPKAKRGSAKKRR